MTGMIERCQHCDNQQLISTVSDKENTHIFFLSLFLYSMAKLQKVANF